MAKFITNPAAVALWPNPKTGIEPPDSQIHWSNHNLIFFFLVFIFFQILYNLINLKQTEKNNNTIGSIVKTAPNLKVITI